VKPALVWTPQAREDLIEIYVTIGFDNVPAADRLFAAIEAKVLLIHSPCMGVRRTEIAPTARMLVEGAYVNSLRVPSGDEDAKVEEVEIVRMVDGRRDLSRIF
jgi:toxin ParE1/3/4